MSGNLLKIKISIPPLGTNILQRPSLLEGLESNLAAAAGFNRRLTLISAPAGFGKTTLARSWLINREKNCAWYSLDEGDNVRERFWLYLVSALSSVREDLGKGTLEMLRSSALGAEDSMASDVFLTPLLNDLFELENPLSLVLDDYHQINNTQIHRDMIFFLENLPPTLHLIVTTRSEPPWPLARWRGRDSISEVRQRDLRFSREETGRLFSGVKGLQLSETQLSTLHHKTEGWITGLQLAAASLSHNPDAAQLIETFAGSHQHVFHFLSEEVFNRQPQSVQSFLLQTSVLKRFCAPLCNAITGREDSAELLAALDRNHLFVIALDESGVWYRYHPLFVDLLLHHLKQSGIADLNDLHSRAADWFLQAGEPGEAVHHAIGGEDLEKAARILNQHLEEIVQHEGTTMIVASLDLFPRELLKQYPRLVAHKCWFHLVQKGMVQAKTYLELAAEVSSGCDDPGEMEEIRGILAVCKAYYQIYTHNFSCALENAEKALELLPANSYYWRSKVGIVLGDARLFAGNPRDALPFYREAHWNDRANDNLYLFLSSGFKTATTLYYRGCLQEGEELARELLETARREGFSRVPRIGLLWTLLGGLLKEKGELEEAARCVERGLFISEPEKPSQGWNYLFKVDLSFARLDFNEGLKTIAEIVNLHREVKLPQFILIPAATWKARILIEQGILPRAREALDRIGVKEDTPLKGGLERGYLTLSRLITTENPNPDNLAKAGQWLEQIEEMATAGENRRLLLELYLYRARLEEQSGNTEAAERNLLFALETGVTAGYFQTFIDEGRALALVYSRILKATQAEQSNTSSMTAKDLLAYGSRLYKIISPPQGPDRAKSQTDSGETRSSPPPLTPAAETSPDATSFQSLAEELSSRELEVLKLISQGLSNQQIAAKLFLSLGTVKWHTSNIYGKLGVRGRTHALVIAGQLKLI